MPALELPECPEHLPTNCIKWLAAYSVIMLLEKTMKAIANVVDPALDAGKSLFSNITAFLQSHKDQHKAAKHIGHIMRCRESPSYIYGGPN